MVFGNENIDEQHHVSFYHGVSENMLFDSMNAYVYGPFSATSSFEIAVNFTNMNNGIVLQFIPRSFLKYFDCCWVSRFSNEHELLFISMTYPIHIINITNVNLVIDYSKYIKTIAIIESMMDGWFFSSNTTVIRNFTRWKRSGQEINDALKLGGKPIDIFIQDLALRLIKNELCIKKDITIPDYVCKLFHHTCVKKQRIEITLSNMNTEIREHYQGAGYQGYLFLRNFFFQPNSNIIKLGCINGLYKNLTILQISEASLQTISLYLPILWTYISETKTTIKRFQLELMDGITFSKKMLSDIDMFKHDFNSINYTLKVETFTNTGLSGIDLYRKVV
eukprot:464219_1